jgi:heterokaryon incompatibility protein (HET)
MTDYIYSQLAGPSSIRLLYFESQYQRHGRVNIKLVQADLSTTLVFEALSYTWGDPNEKVPININGKTFHITIHLDAFLRKLAERSPDVEQTQNQLFWADQISINQKDIKERNSQVALMADIYRKSQRTLVWVDRGDESWDGVKSLMRDIEGIGGLEDTRLSSVIQAATDMVERYMQNADSESPSYPFYIELNKIRNF